MLFPGAIGARRNRGVARWYCHIWPRGKSVRGSVPIVYYFIIWPTFHLATWPCDMDFANWISRMVVSLIISWFVFFISIIASRDDVKNPVSSPSGATPEIPPLFVVHNVPSSHVAPEEHSVSGPDTTNMQEIDMSMTNDLLADSAVYVDVVTSTSSPFSAAHGASRPLGDLSSETIISSNVSNWDGIFQSNMACLSKQSAVFTDFVHSSDNRLLHNTRMLENKIWDNTKMLQDQITVSEARLENRISTLQTGTNA